MKGIIIVNAYYHSEEIQYQPKRLRDELVKRGAECEIRENTEIPCALENGRLSPGLEKPDFCVFLDKDKYLLQTVEKTGTRLFNNPRTIRVCDDKMETALCLADQGIPMPDTLAGPLCYRPDAEFSATFEKFAAERLGYPFVYKECYGSRGTGVYLISDRKEFERVWTRNRTKAYLLQEYIAQSRGRDIRVLVIGGTAVGAIERENETDFRSNLATGGTGTPYPMNETLVRLCEKTAAVLGADYCGIDVLVSERGYLVCEVNSNAFFKGFEKATGINAAAIYAEHILSQVENDQ